MLLARKGFKVLLVDRVRFPSDTLSTHQVQVLGAAALNRWGLLQKVLASNCPEVRQASFHLNPFRIQGNFPPLESVGAMLCPRRTILDKVLVDAAVEAGADLHEDLIVEDLLREDGRVTGISARVKTGETGGTNRVMEKARLVIGADGKHSLVAQKTEATQYQTKPVQTCAYYIYWEGLSLPEGGEIYSLPKAAIGLWPTNDGLSIIYSGYPIAEFQAIRGDIKGRFWMSMGLIPGLTERLRSGRQAERFQGTADLPTFYRRPSGPGWALVGDAGMTMDPITGQGIGNAFWDAERLADAVEAGFAGRMSMDTAMTEYEQKRNSETLPMYEFTAQTASFGPPAVEQQVLFEALMNKPQAAEQFLGVLTGSVPVQEFFSPSNLFKIMGIPGMGRVIFSKIMPSRNSHAKRMVRT
jgi:2-polyprenyl-6-methoxyphenol hydroxylase-like FAD-dependent oxidoreductase